MEIASRGSNRDPRAALLALDVALAADLDNDADRLLAADRGELSTCPAAWLSLLRHGRADKAAGLIRDRHADARPAAPRGFGFTDEDASRLPELLSAFASDEEAGLALFAEAALAALPDEEGDRPHLAAVADRFDAGLFTSSRLAEVTLLMLAQDPATHAALEAPLEEVVGPLSLTLLTDDDAFVQRELKLASVSAALARGDTAPLVAESDALHVDPGNRGNLQWEYNEQLQRLGRLLQRAAESESGAYDLDRLVALRPAYESMLAPLTLGSQRNHLEHHLATLLVISSLDEGHSAAGFNAWYDENLADDRDARKPRFRIVENRMKELAPADEAPLDDRLRMLREVLAAGLDWNVTDVFKDFIDRDGLLTPDEMAEHGEALAEPLGLAGSIGVATALATKKHAGAAAAWDRAIASAAEPGADEADRMLLIERLAEHDRLDDAVGLARDSAPEDEQVKERLQKFRDEHPQAEPATQQAAAAPGFS